MQGSAMSSLNLLNHPCLPITSAQALLEGVEQYSRPTTPRQLVNPVAPCLASAARAAHYEETLKPAKLARMTAAERLALVS